MTKYKIRHLQDNTYQVYENDDERNWDTEFQGSLADCEAWIRLKESGRM